MLKKYMQEKPVSIMFMNNKNILTLLEGLINIDHKYKSSLLPRACTYWSRAQGRGLIVN